GICLITGIILGVLSWSNHGSLIPWFLLKRDLIHQIPHSEFAYCLWWIFITSWGLLLFNLLPVFPMDGGRILQTSLWCWIGQYRATLIACVVGMVGSVLMAMYGLANFGSWYGSVLLFIGISCFLTCYSTRLATKAAGPWEESDDGIDYSAAYDIHAG